MIAKAFQCRQRAEGISPYRNHNDEHKWKDCPDNWHNKNGDKDNKEKTTNCPRRSATNQGEVKIMESGSSWTLLSIHRIS